MIRTAIAAAALLIAAPATAQVATEMTAPRPQGALGGTLIDPGGSGPLVVIVPGSGPTDRNGDNALGVKGGVYRQLAEALAKTGVATLRIDKRGMFGSSAALADANAATIAGYADDVHAWAKLALAKSRRRCVWVLGHSEGGLVALQAAQDPRGLCGIVLLSTPGRPIGTVLREQFRANPANAPILAPALAAIDALEAGRPVPAATLPAPLPMVFPDAVQPFLIDLMAHDPARLIAHETLPTLIVQGTRDIQVSVADAQALKAAQPKAALALLPDVNHVLRPVTSADRAANAATYGDASLPISPSVAATIAAFVKGR